MENIIIAIDGPAGTGKGTIASHIAKHYGYYYLDTGIYYRAITYKVIQENINLDEEDKIINIASSLNLDIFENQVTSDGEDISSEIRSNEVNSIVSQISRIIEVRKIVNDYIKEYSTNKNIVVDGRDTTTVIFPNANYKIYLDAAVDARARRRFNQNIESGIEANFDDILNNIKLRDESDKNKEFGALKIAEDAIVVDSTNKTIEETINEIINIIGSEE